MDHETCLIKPPPKYTLMKDITSLGHYKVIGLVIKVLDVIDPNPKSAKLKDYKSSFLLLEPSQKGMLVSMFRPSRNKLVTQPFCILDAERLEVVQLNKGKIKAIIYKDNYVNIYSLENYDFDGIKNQTRTYVKALKDWAGKSKLSHKAAPSLNKHTKLCDLKGYCFYDIIAEVVETNSQSNEFCITLADYTRNEKFPLSEKKVNDIIVKDKIFVECMIMKTTNVLDIRPGNIAKLTGVECICKSPEHITLALHDRTGTHIEIIKENDEIEKTIRQQKETYMIETSKKRKFEVTISPENMELVCRSEHVKEKLTSIREVRLHNRALIRHKIRGHLISIDEKDYRDLCKLYCNSCQTISTYKTTQRCMCFTKNFDGFVFCFGIQLASCLSKKKESIEVQVFGTQAEKLLRMKPTNLYERNLEYEKLKQTISRLTSKTEVTQLEVTIISFINKNNTLCYHMFDTILINN